MPDAYYVKAQQVRALIPADYEGAFARVDVVALPTSPTVAFRLGERTADPLQMYLSDLHRGGQSGEAAGDRYSVRIDEGEAAGGTG